MEGLPSVYDYNLESINKYWTLAPKFEYDNALVLSGMERHGFNEGVCVTWIVFDFVDHLFTARKVFIWSSTPSSIFRVYGRTDRRPDTIDAMWRTWNRHRSSKFCFSCF